MLQMLYVGLRSDANTGGVLDTDQTDRPADANIAYGVQDIYFICGH